jgi:hypothetical protein
MKQDERFAVGTPIPSVYEAGATQEFDMTQYLWKLTALS